MLLLSSINTPTLHLQESGAVAMGEDWKLDLKQKEMQQAKVGHVKHQSKVAPAATLTTQYLQFVHYICRKQGLLLCQLQWYR